MKYKNIMSFFYLSLPLCVLIRTLQVFYTIDGSTGFMKQGYRPLSFKMMVLVCAMLIVTAIIGATTHRCPTDAPKVKLPLGIASIALGVGIFYDIAQSVFAATVPAWQIILINLFGFLSALFFIAYGAKAFFNYEIPALLSVLPVFYWVIKLIYVFTSISALSLITDNVFMLATYCCTLIFMLQYAKLMNKIDSEYNFKKILSSGLCAVTLCAVSALPRLFAIVTGNSQVLHESVSSMLTTLLSGIFIFFFIHSHFSNGNLKAKKHNHGSVTYLETSGKDNNFYIDYNKR